MSLDLASLLSLTLGQWCLYGESKLSTANIATEPFEYSNRLMFRRLQNLVQIEAKGFNFHFFGIAIIDGLMIAWLFNRLSFS